MNTPTSLSPAELDRLARKRAGAKMGWYIHAMVYVLVNTGLAALSALQDHQWAVFPALGWGLGLAIHGAVVFLRPARSGFYSTLVQRERERLEAQRDPW
nr:2TM domain-containing protein [uncultured Rhodoferax sp.]